MSAGRRLPLAAALEKADRLVELLAPACDRIEIAGSIRRGQAAVGDIELVAVPSIVERRGGLWGDLPEPEDVLARLLAELATRGELVPRDVEIHRADGRTEMQRRVGDRYQALAFRGLPVDLFIVRPPASWGVIFTIRTGPADWSARLVSDMRRRFRRVEDGRLLDFGQDVDCPEERDFLAAIGQAWVEPAERSAARVALP